jgi:hypothetical protein
MPGFKNRRPNRERAISASSAAKNFGRLIEQVRSERAVYVVERGGAPAVRITPVATARFTIGDLVGFLRAEPRPDDAYLDAVETGVSALNRPAVPKNPWAR